MVRVGRQNLMGTNAAPGEDLFARFVATYYAELPEFDIDDRRAEDLNAVARVHLDVGNTRRNGQTIVQVFAPERANVGLRSDRSVVVIVTDDAPFLVDSVRIVLERHAIATHLLVHPVICVDRGPGGRLINIDATRGRAGTILEAWTQVEIDRCDAMEAESLQHDLSAAIGSVHRVVADSAAMRDRMADLVHVDPLLGWLADGEFVFMGAAQYDIWQDGAICRPGSALGQIDAGAPADPDFRSSDSKSPTVMIARTSQVASVHRPSRMTSITVTHIGDDGKVVADRFVGLLASTANRCSVFDIPSISDRVKAVLGGESEHAETHTARSIRDVVESLPRDLIFELCDSDLGSLVTDVVGLQERQIVRVFDVPEPVGDASTVLVFLPKTRFTNDVPERVARVVAAHYGSPARDLKSFVGSSNLARITFSVNRVEGSAPDLDALSSEVDRITTSWIDRVQTEAAALLGEDRGLELVRGVARSAPEGYTSIVDPHDAVGDLDRLAGLLEGSGSLCTALVAGTEAAAGDWRMRVYKRGEPIALSDLLPLLGHVGLHALDEHPYEFVVDGERVFLYDIGVLVPANVTIDDHRHAELESVFAGLLLGEVEADGFNRLVLHAGLTAQQSNVLRVYAKFAHQTAFGFSQGYIQDCLVRLPGFAGLLVALFDAKFDPDGDEATRQAVVEAADLAASQALDAVPSLDDDRIGRMFLTLIRATVRTSAYQNKPTVALKFDPTQIEWLPAPRPKHEIFVFSSRVEGVHLRAGAIARGGLRWSDRLEDYRTEVLGLVKAQMVKNAVIVPVGAKGGFVVKHPKQNPGDNRLEVAECYRMFVRGLLDLTDNVVAGRIVPPNRTVRYDGDDPYLVVAADKGTATFSDTANQVAAEYEFWLGDAFASGGSAGYDHKQMAITARGAWESVRRHASILGMNADTEPLSVVGIGDMSGDVFGNGLLRSPHLRLVAAFDHRHIFLDPNPNSCESFRERGRLFEASGTSWADYDEALISEGGGVFARSEKSINISGAAAAALAIDAGAMTPNELIASILRAPVDLLWNGGIGTYVKGSSESDAAVGDRANDAVRVCGSDLRCKMVVEGGNLGLTQHARVEYALAGGLINTDAIDNSGGVDCSDHEVNIKILLSGSVADGELTVESRDRILHDMTSEVAELVLDNNRAQTLTLMVARRQALSMVNVHIRYLDQLEVEGWIDRSLECLPSTKQLGERQNAGGGLQAPEFAVLNAYTKNVNIAEVLRTDLPDSSVFERDLVDYFPTALRVDYRDRILTHRLRREIVATQVVNQMVNLSGISYDHRMTEDTGADVSDVVAAWVVCREILDFPTTWAEIADLEGIDLDDQLELFLDCRRMAERCSLWFLRHRRPPIDIATEIGLFRDPIRALVNEMGSLVRGPLRQAVSRTIRTRKGQGIRDDLAERSAVWRLAHTGFDVVELARNSNVTPAIAAEVYWSMFDQLDLLWLWDAIGALPRADRWQTQARSSLRDDLMSALWKLAGSALEQSSGSVDAWINANHRSVQRSVSLLAAVRRAGNFDVTNLSVALRQLRNLGLTSAR